MDDFVESEAFEKRKQNLPLSLKRQGCQSGAMALKTAPVKIYWRQGLLSQRQTPLQQAIMNCLTALSGHAANARCSTVAPQRRHMNHGHTCSQIRAHIYMRQEILRMRSARNCFGAAFSAPAKINIDTPEENEGADDWSCHRGCPYQAPLFSSH